MTCPTLSPRMLTPVPGLTPHGLEQIRHVIRTALPRYGERDPRRFGHILDYTNFYSYEPLVSAMAAIGYTPRAFADCSCFGVYFHRRLPIVVKCNFRANSTRSGYPATTTRRWQQNPRRLSRRELERPLRSVPTIELVVNGWLITVQAVAERRGKIDASDAAWRLDHATRVRSFGEDWRSTESHVQLRGWVEV